MAFLHDCDVDALNLTASTCPARLEQETFGVIARLAMAGWTLALGGLLLIAYPAVALSAPGATAQQTQTSPPRHVVHYHKRKKAKAKEEVVASPAAPPPPVPPAQQPARTAKVEFSRDSLRIDADNSSLIQILNDVSRQTGMVVDGLNHDERIYGQYGPGPVAGTLTQLLDGAGYDYVIIGGDGEKAPTKLVLTTASSAGPEATPAPMTTATYSAPAASSVPANPSEPVHPKTPQEIFDELRRMHPPQ